jgi:hypothetical protein
MGEVVRVMLASYQLRCTQILNRTKIRGGMLLLSALAGAHLPTGVAAEAYVQPFAPSADAALDTSVKEHLERALAYMAQGDDARAKIEFEAVLHVDELPSDLHQQVGIYARLASDYLRGQRLLPHAYVLLGAGNYRVNPNKGTDEFGGSNTDDLFFNVRLGGGLTYALDDGYALEGSLDYRYRDYRARDEDIERRDDKDLRWGGALSHVQGDVNTSLGVRGRASYRGEGQYRHDYGVFSRLRYTLDAENQLSAGAELRRRQYPVGVLRVRSRNITEVSGGWVRALWAGKASFNLAAHLGHEMATEGRADGDSTFIIVRPSLNVELSDDLGAFVAVSWEHQRYQTERNNLNAAGEVLGFVKRVDDLFEVRTGLSWTPAPQWSLNPEIVYSYDSSTILAANYSATEVWLLLRRDF